MNEILQKRIEEAVETLINYNLVDLGDLVNQYDLRRMLIEMGVKTLQNQWISVEEALPNYEEDVLVTNDVGDYWFSHRTENENVMQDENNFASVNGIFKITHWMPIPSLEGGEE